MKRFSFSLAVLLVAFLFGLSTFLIWSFSGRDEAQNLIATDCVQSSSFPGRSIEINSVQLNEYGYFPKGILGWNDGMDNLKNKWNSVNLTAMNEPSLLKTSNEENYRFLWWRSFHNPIAVRVWHENGEFFISYAELGKSKGFLEPGDIVAKQSRQLNPAEWCKFLSLLEKSDYWNFANYQENVVPDGASWIIEGVRNGRYHIVDLQSPRDGEYREACLYLLKLAGFKPENPDEIY